MGEGRWKGEGRDESGDGDRDYGIEGKGGNENEKK